MIKTSKRRQLSLVLCFVALISALMLATSCSSESDNLPADINPKDYPAVSYNELISHPEKYDFENVRVSGKVTEVDQWDSTSGMAYILTEDSHGETLEVYYYTDHDYEIDEVTPQVGDSTTTYGYFAYNDGDPMVTSFYTEVE